MNHRFLDKIDDNIKKGANQLFLYGNLEDYFLFDVYLGIRSLRNNLFFYFVKSDFDYFIEVNGDNIIAFDKENKSLNLDEAFSIDKKREGFANKVRAKEFEKIKDKKTDIDTSSVENEAEAQAGFNARDKILKNFDERKLLIFIPDIEYQAELYKDENINFIRFLKDLQLSKNSVSIITIKNLEHLQKFDFDVDEKSKKSIFISNPNVEEIKTAFIRETLKNGNDIDWYSIDELAQALQASKKTLREAMKILKSKGNKKVSLNNFKDVLEKNIPQSVTFNDVILKDKNKIINTVEVFLENKEESQKGIILYGPPGTGKTFIAKAIASEFNMYFLSPTLADIKGEFVGESGKKVKKLFEEARANSPAIIFLDEMDTLFKKRGDGDSYVEDMVNQFLVEIDGVNSAEDRIFIIGATNRLETIDDAIKSRLSLHFEIPLPNRNEREKIISKQFKKFDFTKSDFKDEVLNKTEGMSGRDIFYLCKDVKNMCENENVKKSNFKVALEQFEKKLIEQFKSKLEGSLKIEEPTTTFRDVVGYKEIKDSLKDEVEYILNEESRNIQKEFNIKQNRGTILYGPPGNGKTTFAEALAGENNFYYIRIVSRDFISSTLEDILKKLETIFEDSVKLSKITSKNGVVLFFDEIDSLIGKENLNPIIRGTLLKYLEDKKGIKSDDSKIVFIAATNHFEKLDKASIRDGRFDNKFEVGYPIEGLRWKILETFLNNDDYIDNNLNDNIIQMLIKSIKKDRISVVDLKNLKEQLKRFAFKEKSIKNNKILIDENIIKTFLGN